MPTYFTKSALIFVLLFCSNSLISAGTQSLAQGIQNDAPVSDDSRSASYSNRWPGWYFDNRHIDSGQIAPDDLSLDKRVPSGFMGMRGKKASTSDQHDDYVSNPSNDERNINSYSNSFDPNMIDEQQIFEYLRRAAIFFDETELPSDSRSENSKRAPYGFVGMRGKRNLQTNADSSNRNWFVENGVIKRAPIGGFMGMRGKKVPSGFFGMRGKKIPVDFRAKFVGVRGKKVPAGSVAFRDSSADRIGEYMMPELQSANSMEETMDAESSKRAPSGFHGMRGKKSDADTDE